MSHVWMMSQPDFPLYSRLGNLRWQERRMAKTHKALLGQFLHKKHTFHCFCISQCRAGLELEISCLYVQIYILLGKLHNAKELFHAPELNGPYLAKHLGHDFGPSQRTLLSNYWSCSRNQHRPKNIPSRETAAVLSGRLRSFNSRDTGYSVLAGLRTRERSICL